MEKPQIKGDNTPKLVVKFPVDLPKEERERITKNFEDTIDEYLKKVRKEV